MDRVPPALDGVTLQCLPDTRASQPFLLLFRDSEGPALAWDSTGTLLFISSSSLPLNTDWADQFSDCLVCKPPPVHSVDGSL